MHIVSPEKYNKNGANIFAEDTPVIAGAYQMQGAQKTTSAVYTR